MQDDHSDENNHFTISSRSQKNLQVSSIENIGKGADGEGRLVRLSARSLNLMYIALVHWIFDCGVDCTYLCKVVWRLLGSEWIEDWAKPFGINRFTSASPNFELQSIQCKNTSTVSLCTPEQSTLLIGYIGGFIRYMFFSFLQVTKFSVWAKHSTLVGTWRHLPTDPAISREVIRDVRSRYIIDDHHHYPIRHIDRTWEEIGVLFRTNYVFKGGRFSLKTDLVFNCICRLVFDFLGGGRTYAWRYTVGSTIRIYDLRREEPELVYH